MGAAIKPTTHDDKNPTTFPLIWLDSLVNTSQENLDGQRLIRSSIDHLKTFEDINKCEEYIRSVSHDERIILIVSGRLGQEITPRIHQLRQISSIYVYCLDKSLNEKWIKQYKKIKDIITKFDELIYKIRSERAKRSQNEVSAPFPISIFHTNSSHERSNDKFNDHFIYSQLLIDALLRLKPINTDKDKLIRLCKEEYHEIDNELKLIQEFQDDYSSNEALYWYMKDSFIYRLFNKSLRSQNIDLLFLFRFFIHDIRQAIKQSKCTSPIRVYRSQLMTKDEIDLFENSIGNLISINSFFSTSVYRELALLFLTQSSSSNDLEKVLFEINADPLPTYTKPFGFIESNNYFRQTEEVLFTLGSIFRLISIQHQSDGIWIIQLSLCTDNDSELKEIFKPFKTNENISLISFGNLLRKMGQSNKAEKFFTQLLNELSENSQNIADCYYALGCIAMEKKIYDSSFQWHQKSLDVKLKILKEDDSSLADSYNSIAQIYLKKSDYKQALASYCRALKITMLANGENHTNVAICYTNIGGVYQKQENYVRALECHKTALDIYQKNVLVDHPDLGISHNNIAIIYSCLGLYDSALEHYNISLNILQNTLSSSNPEIAVSYCGLGLIYEQKGELEKALSYYEKTATIYRHALSSTHPDVIQIEEHIQRISSKLK
jgi:tetratricopeptide (TPR) repeat protein